MKITYILVFVVIAFSCNKDDNPTSTTVVAGNLNDTSISGVLTGKWKLMEYQNLTLGTIESEPTDISTSVIIDFSDNGTQGKIGGHTITNAVGGNYELLKDNKMKTLLFYGTKVWEPKWGSKFWDAIRLASSYERQDNKLFIYFNSDTEKMKFEKQ